MKTETNDRSPAFYERKRRLWSALITLSTLLLAPGLPPRLCLIRTAIANKMLAAGASINRRYFGIGPI